MRGKKKERRLRLVVDRKGECGFEDLQLERRVLELYPADLYHVLFGLVCFVYTMCCLVWFGLVCFVYTMCCLLFFFFFFSRILYIS